MTGPRVTIGGLMGLVVVAAVGIAALRSASALWVSVTLTATLGVLLAAIFGIVYRRGAARAYWLGFAVFGWAYMLASFGPWFDTTVEPYLLTTRSVVELHERMYPPPERKQAGRTKAELTKYYDATRKSYSETVTSRYFNISKSSFIRIGHALSGLIAAVVGGVVARWFYATGPGGSSQTAGDGPSATERTPRGDLA